VYQSNEQAHPLVYAPPNTQTTAYIVFQLHSMLKKSKLKITTNSPHGHHPLQTMQPSVEIFFYSKDASLPCDYCA
jgi:hypothetical protein